MPSGVPPTPSSRSMPVSGRAAMIAPATSPSLMNLIIAPVARMSATRLSWRGRSSSMTVTSSARLPLALATAAMLSRDGRLDVDDVGGLGAGDQLLHVEDRRRVVHRPARRDREHRDGVRHALGRQGRAVDRVDRDVALGSGAVADLLAVVEHRRVVLLALADDHGAVHADGRDQHPHGVDRHPVGAVLVAAAHPAAGGHGSGLGDPHELQGQVAVGGLGRDVETTGWGARGGAGLRGGRGHGRMLSVCTAVSLTLNHTSAPGLEPELDRGGRGHVGDQLGPRRRGHQQAYGVAVRCERRDPAGPAVARRGRGRARCRRRGGRR